MGVKEFHADEAPRADFLLILVEDAVCLMNPGDRLVRVSEPFTLLLQFAFDFLLSGVDDLDIAVKKMCDNRQSDNQF